MIVANRQPDDCLTVADKRHLNGQVSMILRRGSTGATDLIVMLHEIFAQRAKAANGAR